MTDISDKIMRKGKDILLWSTFQSI
jgi:hypothetical protein